VKKGGARIAELRELLHFSQKDFAKKIGITQGALSQIESDKSKASFETIKRISNEFNVNCNWLVRGFGEVLLSGTQQMDAGYKGWIKEKVFIPLIREEAHAGYIDGFKNKDYFKELDVYQIPGFEKGEYRLFEIIGESMIPTLYPGEIVVCEFIVDASSIGNSTLCVVISKEGIVAKRVFQNPDNEKVLVLKSDNVDFEPQTIYKSKVLEAWSIRGKITTQLSNVIGMDARRLEKIENDILEIRSYLEGLARNPG
jgi:transcriptional regulator with XRE-family HTH domain